MTGISDLKLRFLGSLVEQLGAQMYPSATATIAELISNAWDADARNVWVEIPLGERWTADKQIVVTDDGIGMSHADARDMYLNVGRKRRKEEGTEKSPGGRPLHGRKGIGKLAAFGTARILEFRSRRNDSEMRFRMDYDSIRATPPGDDYQVEGAHDDEPLCQPDGTPLTQGTRIKLLSLRLKRAIPEEQFRLSMSRRFALTANDMQVFVNGEIIERFDYPVEFHFPRDGTPNPSVSVATDGWAEETIDSNHFVRWWIGFTEKPLRDQALQGISVLARGKMAQRPFLFQRAQGVTGQLGQEYLIGEVEADWLDEGDDIDSDHIQANRDQLQLENEELEPFIRWGQGRLQWALATRNSLRRDKTEERVLITDPRVTKLFESLTSKEQSRVRRIAQHMSLVPEITPEDIFHVISDVVNAMDDVEIRKMWEGIDDEAPDVQAKVWDIIRRFSLIDARRHKTIIDARLKAIRRLREYVISGDPEVPTIHDHIKRNPWLINPGWHLYDDEVDIRRDFGIDYQPEPGTGAIADFMFGLRPNASIPNDDVIIVEIKRGTTSSGTTRQVNVTEINRFETYVLAAVNHFEKSTNRPRVTGLMIAQSYNDNALMKRRNLETSQMARFMFSTWEAVIEDTERFHRSWLDVETRRAEGSDHSTEV